MCERVPVLIGCVAVEPNTALATRKARKSLGANGYWQLLYPSKQSRAGAERNLERTCARNPDDVQYLWFGSTSSRLSCKGTLGQGGSVHCQVGIPHQYGRRHAPGSIAASSSLMIDQA